MMGSRPLRKKIERVSDSSSSRKLKTKGAYSFQYHPPIHVQRSKLWKDLVHDHEISHRQLGRKRLVRNLKPVQLASTSGVDWVEREDEE